MTPKNDRRKIEAVKNINLKEFVKSQGLPYKEFADHIKVSCVFHPERTGSLAIYDDSYHCYGCGEHGDIIDWIMNLYKINFKEAVEKLLHGRKIRKVYRERY